MKIVLFDSIGAIGIVSDWKAHIDGNSLRFDVDRRGILNIGARSFDVSGGVAYFPTYYLVMGEPQAISFTDENKNTFCCGTISRTGSHMIKITNPVEPCIIALCQAYDELSRKVLYLQEEHKKIKSEYGVSFE